jgi:hypothetical protein
VREGGRDELSSLAMQLSFTGQEPVPQNGPRDDSQHRTFLVIVSAIDQDVGHEFGRINQHYAGSPELRSPDPGNPAAQIFQHPKPVAEQSA